jgi:ABC-type dipeptide/oligopeptide/nickel transport system permease component
MIHGGCKTSSETPTVVGLPGLEALAIFQLSIPLIWRSLWADRLLSLAVVVLFAFPSRQVVLMLLALFRRANLTWVLLPTQTVARTFIGKKFHVVRRSRCDFPKVRQIWASK